MKKVALILSMCFGILIHINAQNNCLNFDGSNDYVSIPDAASLDITDQITMEAWVKPTGGASNYWNYKKLITIESNYVQGTETDFPVMISVTDADLKDTGNGGPVQTDADDIMFTLTNGTKLSHEIELYTGSTGRLVAWVKIPSLSNTTDTDFYMYYGNSACTSQQDAANVWDDDYKGVWHLLGGAGSTTLPDATSNLNTGTKLAATEPLNTALGQIDGAQVFDGTNDYVDVSGVGSYTTGSTFFAWFNTATINSGYTAIIGYRECLNQYAMDNKVHIYANDGEWTELISNTIISADTWYLYTAVHDGSTLKLYINGVYDNEINVGTLNPDANFPNTHIGLRANNTAPFEGTIDEVRISASVRSGDWIKTEYNNQKNPGTFMSFSNQTAAGISKSGAYGLGASNSNAYASINGQAISADVTANVWNHIALTYNKDAGSDQMKLYVNGVQKTQGTYSTAISTNDNALLLGDMVGFKGVMDEVRIWNDVRTETEIRANMYDELTDPTNEANLVAYYKFNEESGITADNAKGTAALDGTLYNMVDTDWVTSPAFAGPKNCLDFDGTDEYVDIGTGPTTVKAVELWINPATTTEYIIDLDGGTHYIWANSGTITAAGFISPTIYVNGVATTTIVASKWQHIAVTTSTGINANDLDIGKVGANEEFDGKIDEVRLWSDVRTETEIRDNMCKSLTGNETGLVAYYNFDNSVGTTLQDFNSSTKHDGTLTNMEDADWVSSTAFNTWLNVVNSTWSTTTNWSRGSAPASADNVGISNYSGGSQPTLSSAVSCNNLAIGSSSTLTVSSNTLTPSGNVLNEGTISVSGTLTNNSASSTFINNGTFTDNGTVTLRNLTINSGKSLTINSGKSLTVNGTFTNSAGNSGLVIKSDATGTGSLIESSGVSATVERFITQDIYHYLSSPVSSQALTLLQEGTVYTDYDLFYYWEACDFGGGPAWINAGDTASGILEVGLGYAYTYNPADRTLEFTGTTNTGNTTENISFSGGDTWYYGWNLVGNPYPSRINATTFINDVSNANIYGTLYFWDEAAGYLGNRNDYATWNTSGGVAGGGKHTPNGYIDVGQAFMVHTTTALTSVSFKNDMRVHDAAQFFKGEVQRFKISVENTDGVYNETLIAFLEGTTNGFDNKYDGYKLKGNPNIALYTKLVEDDGYDYAIQGLPPLTDGSGVTVKLGLDAGAQGNYTFKVVDIENFHDTTSIFLEDLYENITVNMRKSTKYTFNINEPGSITDRFLLHFSTSALGIDEPENINNRINVYTYDNIICVENYNPAGDIYVEVYNTLGQQLISRKLVNQQKNEITLNAGRGIYIVRVFCEDKVYTAKVYLGN